MVKLGCSGCVSPKRDHHWCSTVAVYACRQSFFTALLFIVHKKISAKHPGDKRQNGAVADFTLQHWHESLRGGEWLESEAHRLIIQHGLWLWNKSHYVLKSLGTFLCRLQYNNSNYYPGWRKHILYFLCEHATCLHFEWCWSLKSCCHF